MKSLATFLLTIAMPALAVAADASDVEYTCDWSQDGKQYTISGHNPYTDDVSCSITCIYKLADGSTFSAHCSGSIRGKSDGEICTSPVSGASKIVDDTDDDDATCN
jgi:hypothetical protein